MGRTELIRSYIPVDEEYPRPGGWFRVVDEGNGATFEAYAGEFTEAIELSQEEAASKGVQLTGQFFVRLHEPIWQQELEGRFGGGEFKAFAVEPNSADPLGSHKH